MCKLDKYIMLLFLCTFALFLTKITIIYGFCTCQSTSNSWSNRLCSQTLPRRYPNSLINK